MPRRGRTIEGTVYDPDGKPVSHVVAVGLTSHVFHRVSLATPHFEVKVLDPKEKRGLFFLDKEKGLGRYQEIRGDEPGPLSIRLERCGAATGRILDRNGQPVPELVLHCERHVGVEFEIGTRTDREGRFRFEGLVPGEPYNLWYGKFQAVPYKAILVEPDKVKDLGDAKIDLDEPGMRR